MTNVGLYEAIQLHNTEIIFLQQLLNYMIHNGNYINHS